MGDIGRGLLHGVKKITKCIIITAQQIGKKKKKYINTEQCFSVVRHANAPLCSYDNRHNAAFFPNPNKHIARAAARL